MESRFQVNPKITRMYDRLQLVNVGDTLFYEELSELAGTDIQSEPGRGWLYSARRKVERDHRMLFSAVENVGLQRAGDADLANLGPVCIDRIRRMASTGVRRMSMVGDFGALPDADKRAHNVGMSHLGAVYACTKPEVRQRLEARITSATTIDVSETMKLIRGDKA